MVRLKSSISKKTICLIGFSKKNFIFIKKKFKKIKFISSRNIDKKFYNFDAVINYNRIFLENFLKKFDFNKNKKIKWIHLPVAGLEDYLYLKNYKNISFTSCKNIQGIQVADHAMALLLSLTRKINYILKKGQKAKFDITPTELKNKNVLILGYGGIGKALTERLYGFGVNTSVVTKKKTQKSRFVKKFYLTKDLVTAAKKKDILFIAIPENNKNRGLINKKIIGKLNNRAIIINVARESIFNFKSIKKNLLNGKIGGLGIDYLKPKFLKKNAYLLKMDNVILTPHTAGLSDIYIERHIELIVQNLGNFFKKKKLINKAF